MLISLVLATYPCMSWSAIAPVDFTPYAAKYIIIGIGTDWAMNKKISLGNTVYIEKNAIRITDNTITSYDEKFIICAFSTKDCNESYFEKWKVSTSSGISYEEIPYAFEGRVVSLYQKSGDENLYLSECEQWDTGGSGCSLQLKLKIISNE